MAHTLAYDGTVMGDTQQGRPFTDRWHAEIPAIVVVGENSEPFFRDAARTLSELLASGEYGTLPGQDHSAVMTAPGELAGKMADFFNARHNRNR
ncbi:alpha/beta fold hydrolase [Cohnella massiliensis]|uniref:alpha/beta fold hydrolase n=1 Tax=Cohnella massiliensis TaxID=1816691 RepID=UPI0009BB58D4|nr:hypothetical protein [Cohnella massiliensis]